MKKLLNIGLSVTVALTLHLVALNAKVIQDSPLEQVDHSTQGHEGNSDEHSDQSSCFKAAVLEYAVAELPDVLNTIRTNMGVFKSSAKLAAENGAKIIVFPEDGILTGHREIYTVLAEIPDPNKLSSSMRNPCDDDFGDLTHPILEELSCIAKENNIYVVANLGGKEHCQPHQMVGDRECPDSGRFLLNTNIIFDNKGNFIKRYRKYNPWFEVFERPPKLETVYFDTPFGRFGVFTCFDLHFVQPAIDLVKKHQVDTIIFPTFWHDEIPLLTAIQYQDGWSSRNHVNLLASNILKPQVASAGSGIFSNKEFIHTNSNTTRSSLVIANIPTRPRSTKSDSCFKESEPQIIEIGPVISAKRLYYDWKTNKSDGIHVLKDDESEARICSGQVCCSLMYKVNQKSRGQLKSKVVLIARDSNREHSFQWYEQVCVVATLRDNYRPETSESLGYSSEGIATFDELRLTAITDSEYMYPIAAYDSTKLIDRKDRSFECSKLHAGRYQCTLALENNPLDTIYSFGLYGRLFSKDK